MIARTLFILCLLSFHTYASEALTKLNFGYVGLKPFTYMNAEGEPAGFLYEIVEDTLNKANIKFTTALLPSKRLKEYLKSGYIDFWVGIDSNDLYTDITLVGSKPITKLILHVYYIGEKKQFTSIEDLTNESIMMIRGYGYGGITNKLLTYNMKKHIYTKSHATGFKMLESGRANFFLAYERPAKEYLLAHPINNLHEITLSSFPIYFMVSKKTENAEKLLAQLEQELSTE